MTSIQDELKLIDARRERWRKLYRKNAKHIWEMQRENSWVPTWKWLHYGFYIYRDNVVVHKSNQCADEGAFKCDKQPDFTFPLYYDVTSKAGIEREFEWRLGRWYRGQIEAVKQEWADLERTMELYRKAGLLKH